MVGRWWDAREPNESPFYPVDEVWMGVGREGDELHDQIHSPSVFEAVHYLGNARCIRVRVRPCIVEDVRLSLEFRP